MGDWILNPFIGKMSWPNQGILHPISSILTYYGPQTDIFIKSYTRLKLKKIFRKKAFRQYEWRDPPREQQLANSTGESTRCRHVSNSPFLLASPFQKQTPRKKFQNSLLLGISF